MSSVADTVPRRLGCIVLLLGVAVLTLAGLMDDGLRVGLFAFLCSMFGGAYVEWRNYRADRRDLPFTWECRPCGTSWGVGDPGLCEALIAAHLASDEHREKAGEQHG